MESGTQTLSPLEVVFVSIPLSVCLEYCATINTNTIASVPRNETIFQANKGDNEIGDCASIVYFICTDWNALQM